MQSIILSFLLLASRACLAQRFPEYVQFQGNSSAPTRGISADVREALEQADTKPNASHTVRFTSPGSGDWDWTLQISDVDVPAISNSTPDAHVTFTTWRFSRPDEDPMPSKRAGDSPVCAYLMDINFPRNVSSQWNSSDSSCESALGASCVSALSAARITDNCNTQNAPAFLFNIDSCAGKLDGGPNESDSYVTQGYTFAAGDVTDGAWAYALTSPYEAGNRTAFQSASEQLRIMILTGPEGSEAVCNRVATTVDVGAEDDPDSEDGQGSGTNGEGIPKDSSSGGEGGNDASGAVLVVPHGLGLAASAVAGVLAAVWL